MNINPLQWVSEIANPVVDARHASRQLISQALVREYSTMAASAATGPLQESIKHLIAEGEKRNLSWLELYDFESLLVRLRDDAGLRRSTWSIRREVKQLASEDLWKDYQDSKPPAPDDPKVPTDVIRRDIEDLLCKLHELRLGRSLLEFIRAYTTVVTIGVCAILVVALLWCAHVYATNYAKKPQETSQATQAKSPAAATQSNPTAPPTQPNPTAPPTQPGLPAPPTQPSATIRCEGDDGPLEPTMLWLATAGGIFGAAFSMLNRLGQIPTKGDLVARYPSASRRVVWALTPFASLVEGVIAAMILFFILRAGLVSGSLFPEFIVGKGAHSDTWLLIGIAPTVADAAKLAVWCFVAGFSERLVPDMLSRLADQAEKASLAGADKKS